MVDNILLIGGISFIDDDVKFTFNPPKVLLIPCTPIVAVVSGKSGSE